MHYAVPRILENDGQLQMLYTDLCSRKGAGKFAHLIPTSLRTGGVRRLIGRSASGIPVQRICSFDVFGIQYERRRRRARTDGEKNAAFVWGGARFCELILRQQFHPAKGIYTFNTAGLELLEFARHNGVCGIVEQTIAPKKREMELLADERERFPDWETSAPDLRGSEAIIAREAAEWQAAETIVCGSAFVRDGIAACGGPVEKCVVVPYGTDAALSGGSGEQLGFSRPARPLRILTVGGVELRKGAPYTLKVASRLKGIAEFRLVGGVNVPDARATQLRDTVHLTGAVPRSEVSQHFRWADVFFLPSICEGSATVTYEALNAGVPVVCTPNTGSIVEDGISGFVVPAGDIDRMVDRLHRLAIDADLLHELKKGARLKAHESTIEAYSARLLTALNEATDKF